MKIPSSLTQPLLTAIPGGNKPAQLLQPGQQLQATVISVSAPDLVRLRLAATLEVVTHTKLKLAAGQQLLLEVKKGGEKPELRLLNNPNQTGIQAKALRQALPQQINPNQLLEGLRSLSPTPQPSPTPSGAPPPQPSLAQGPPGTTASNLPQAAQSLLSTWSGKPQISPAFLKALQTVITLGKNRLPPEILQQAQRLISNTSQKVTPELLRHVQQLAIPQGKAAATPTVSTQPAPPTVAAATTTPPSASPPPSTTTPLQQVLQLLLGGSGTTQLPANTASELQRVISNLLVKVLPISRGITPDQIGQLFKESGLFLEPKLASGIAPTNDFKANLLRLIFLLRPLYQSALVQQAKSTSKPEGKPLPQAAENSALKLLGEVLRQAEGSLARIQVHQLSSLPTEQGTQQVWQFELPIQYKERLDSFLVRLEKEHKQAEEQDEVVWNLTLSFNIKPLGPVKALLSLQGEEISSLFQAELAESAALIERHLPTLNHALEQAGLKVGQLYAHHAKVEDEEHIPPPNISLLDEKA